MPKKTMKKHWKTLDAEKVRSGVAIVADHLGFVVESPRGKNSIDDLERALKPYQVFAELTLQCGAFDYPVTKKPSGVQIVTVMIDFLRAVGEADAGDEIKLKTALLELEQ